MKPCSKMALEERKLGCKGMDGLANGNIEISFLGASVAAFLICDDPVILSECYETMGWRNRPAGKTTSLTFHMQTLRTGFGFVPFEDLLQVFLVLGAAENQILLYWVPGTLFLLRSLPIGLDHHRLALLVRSSCPSSELSGPNAPRMYVSSWS